MDGDYRRRSGSDRRFHGFRIHAVIRRIRIDENRDALRKENRRGGPRPSIGGNDYFIARTKPACLQGHLERYRPVGCRNAVARALKCSEALVQDSGVGVGGRITSPISSPQDKLEDFLLFLSELRPTRKRFCTNRSAALEREHFHDEPLYPLGRAIIDKFAT